MMIRKFRDDEATLPPTVMNYIIFFLLNLYSGFFFTPNAVYFSIFLALTGTRNKANHRIEKKQAHAQPIAATGGPGN